MSQLYEKPEKPEQTPKSAPPKRAAGKREHRKKGTWFFPEIVGRKRIALYAYTALTVVAGIIVAGYLVFQGISAPPPPPDYSRPPRPSSSAGAEGPDGPEIIQNPGEVSSDRKDQFYTVLLVGQDVFGGGLTDTMMLAAYDVPNQTVSVMSLPRDTYIRRSGRRMLLNSVYNWGGGASGDGIETLKEEVRELTGVPVDYYAIVQWKAFGELVDAIGGVYYDVPRNMNYDDNIQDLHIHVSKGYQLLDGDKAMQVVRFREGANGYIDGDLGRIRTQQGFMKAVVKKCLEPGVLLSNLTEYIGIFQENVNTDLTVNALTYFAKSAVGGLDMDNVEFITMPYRDAGDGHLLPDGEGIIELVNERFNPYLDDIELWELDLETEVVHRPTSTPSPSPTPKETETPEPTESGEPSESPRPTGDPSGPVVPTARPSSRPSAEPSGQPTEEPTGSPTEPTGEPTEQPTEPPADPTPEPPAENTPEPTPEPTPEEAPPLLPEE